MSTANTPTLTADSEGIWRSDAPDDRRSGIAWDDIHSIGGCMLDRKTRGVVAVVTLDWDYGEFFELMEDWPGFDDVVRAITSRVPGIDREWMNRIRSLDPNESIEVWRRP
jgi:hypothetical protein